MNFITGDTHGDFKRFGSKQWPLGRTLNKNDNVIICGDFGGVWSFPLSKHYEQQKYELQWLSDKPWTTLFVDGNHENFDLLKTYPEVEKFGGPVHKITDSIFHLQRGQIYTIDNKKIFTYGGAVSIDKNMRVANVTWWEDELPTVDDETRALENLEKHQYNVDYIVTHTAPKNVVEMLGYAPLPSHIYDYGYLKHNDPTTNFLQHIVQTVNFSRWYFGHFHEDKGIGDYYRALLNDIIRLGE